MAHETMTRITFETAKVADFLARVRAAIRAGADDPLVIDLSAVTYADPTAIEALSSALHEADAAGCETWVDCVAPSVYKALHLAKLGNLLHRVHRGGEPLHS